MDICVTNKATIERALFPKSYALISISKDSSGAANLPDDPKRVALLRLEFADVNCPHEGLQHFTLDMADKVWEFVLECQELRFPLLVVQCLAGLSRSAGIAAAVSKILTGDDSYSFNVYLPNMLVYKVMLRAYPGMTRRKKT